MLMDVAQNRRWPLLLAARVSCNLECCRQDGFDIDEWARENLVDILTLGSRSIDCDIDEFLRVTRGHNIKLQPCHDDHHATDAYQYPSIEFFRGVAANWWRQGADSLMTFNWSNASPDLCQIVGATPGPASQHQAYHEIGSPRTLQGKDKMFVVQRRGGYPWAEGYFNHNDDAVLPLELPADGGPRSVQIRVGDHVSDDVQQIKQVVLRLIMFRADASDAIDAKLNGVPLSLDVRDDDWKDRQIFSSRPQPASGGADRWKINPNQRLSRLDYKVVPRLCKLGLNQVSLRIGARDSWNPDASIKLEKVEVHVRYKNE